LERCPGPLLPAFCMRRFDIKSLSYACMHITSPGVALMKSLTVRGVDDHVYEALRELAGQNHRSMQEQVKMILAREVSLAGGGHLQRCLSLRERLQGRDWGDVAAEIRRERQR